MSGASKLLILCLTGALSACGGAGEGGGNSANGVALANRTGSAGGGSGAQAQTIGASLGSTPELSTLAAAVESAGLSQTLAGAGPYTLFAPGNEAFAAGQTPQERAQLVALLSGHIVPGTVTRQDLMRAVQRGEGGRAELATVGGTNLSVVRDGDGLVIDNGAGVRARIVGEEQIVSNGVVHRVDRVIAAPAAGSAAPPQAR